MTSNLHVDACKVNLGLYYILIKYNLYLRDIIVNLIFINIKVNI